MRIVTKGLLVSTVVGLGGCIVVPASQPVAAVEPTPDPIPVAPEPPPAPPQVVYVAPPPQVVGIYYNDLAPYGRWFIHPRYGRVWTPSYVPNQWQPYTVGHWVYTDDSNCTWVSDDPETQWGGIVYHYGQWVFASDYGWCWVPGTVWAPAWVAWREGGGYCGWAPLPPECGDRTVIGYQDADRYCPPAQFVYVDERTFDQPRVNQRFVRNDVTIINRTTNITNVTVVNNRIVNNGVSRANVQRYTGRQMATVRTADASSPEEAHRLTAAGTPVHFDNSAIEQARAAQIQQRQEKHTELEQKVQQNQRANQQAQQQLKDQREANEKLRDDNAAARQQEAAAKQQQAQADRQAKVEQDRQAQLQREADRQKQADDPRQAALAKQQAHQQDIEAQRQAAQQKQQQRQQAAGAAKQAEQDRRQAAEASRQKAEQDRAAARPNQVAPDQPTDPNAPQTEPGEEEKQGPAAAVRP